MSIESKNVIFNNQIEYPDILINENQITFITGPSGSGKSTLLKIFNGILTPSSGQVFYKGKDIEKWDTIELRRKMLLISQSTYLFDATIKDNFSKFYKFREQPVLSSNEMLDYLKICNVEFPLDQPCTTLSGGERQRVYLAIFLSFQPEVIMLDEPTSALDVNNANTVVQNIIAFCKEHTMGVIIVSHDPKLAKQYSENTIILNQRGLQ